MKKNLETAFIFGAGVKGKAAFRHLDSKYGGRYEIIGYLDNSQQCIGKVINNRVVYERKHILAFPKDIKVFIASNDYNTIIIQLEQMGYYNVIDAGKAIMLEQYAFAFPLCMEKIWNSDRTFTNPYVMTERENGREDLIIEAIFNALGIDAPGYIDIGAHHPVKGSNTYLFYRKGARGITVDPNPTFSKEHSEMRPGDKHLNIALSGTSSEEINYYSMGGWGTVSEQAVSKWKTLHGEAKEIIKVKADTFNNIADKNVQFVDIDTDGYELDILQSINFSQFSKLVVLLVELRNRECLEYMMTNGFTLFIVNYINSIYIRNDMVDCVFADKLCCEIFFWHKMRMLILNKNVNAKGLI